MKRKNLLKTLGPGLLWAGAAIGVSHLVQSTRAGASFGFELVWVIIIINLFKYPFFEFAPRYASTTGESLIQGYKKLGKWAVVVYAIITIATMFILMAAVTAVTAGLFMNVLGSKIGIFGMSTIILVITAVVVAIGKYSVIDKTVKFIIILLAISTIVAVIGAIINGFNPNPELSNHFDWSEGTNIAFLLALAGWMPTAIDVSVWHSVWTVAKIKETGYKPKLKESIFDFKVGYFGTVILSLSFLSLGAFVMYGTGQELSPKGATFAGQLINLFTTNLGSWAYVIIAIAALATMVSTTLTCLDAYPRVLEPTTKILMPKWKFAKKPRQIQWFWLIIVVTGTVIIFAFFMKNMKAMVDFATIISFLVAPVLGYMNLKVVTSKDFPKEAHPSKFLIYLSIAGLFVLSAFGLYYVITILPSM